MFKGVRAYLFREETVVLNKSDVKGAKDEDFREVSLYISYDFIKESVEELEYISDDEDF